MMSFTRALRSPAAGLTILTSLMIFVTCASVRGPPDTAVAPKDTANRTRNRGAVRRRLRRAKSERKHLAGRFRKVTGDSIKAFIRITIIMRINQHELHPKR